jgi:hypothetical protein
MNCELDDGRAHVGADVVKLRPRAEKRLNDVVARVDVAPDNVKGELFFQNLYKSARGKPETGEKPLGDRLKQIVSDFPDFLKVPQNRIQFSYYALSSGDVDLADKFNSSVEASAPVDEQFSAYEVILRSFIHRSQLLLLAPHMLPVPAKSSATRAILLLISGHSEHLWILVKNVVVKARTIAKGA